MRLKHYAVADKTDRRGGRKRAPFGRFRRRHRVETKSVAVVLAGLMLFSIFGANVSSFVKMLDVKAGVFDTDTNEYFSADFTLFDYYNNAKKFSWREDNRQWFDAFNQALFDYGRTCSGDKSSPSTITDSTGYVTAAGNYSNNDDDLFGDGERYPLYLGLQYYNGSTSRIPYFPTYDEWAWNGNGESQKYRYSLAVNSEAQSEVSAAMQGLVDDTLSGGLVTQAGMVLPYFNASFLDQTKNFSGVSFNGKIGATYADKKFRFRKHTTGTYAGYYVFNSANDGLITSNGIGPDSATVNDTDPTNVKYYTASTSGTKHTDRLDNYGFFPLGQSNFGFGAIFDINFTMSEDGRTSGGEPMKFNFSGDDDVWVFIDNHLVLDIGGAHGKVSGEINFSTGKTSVSAVKDHEWAKFSNRNEIGKNNLLHKNQTADVSALFANIGLYSDPSAMHKMKVFYLERGEYESNCLITFNFQQADTLTVTNKVDYSTVNPALRAAAGAVATKEAATFQLANNGAYNGQVTPDHGSSIDDELIFEEKTEGGGSSASTHSITYKIYETNQVIGTVTGVEAGKNVKLWSVIDAGYIPSGKGLSGWRSESNAANTTGDYDYEKGSFLNMPDSDITLYAHFSSPTTVEFYNGSTKIDALTVTGIPGDITPAPNYSDNGTHQLVGWTETQGATVEDYKVGNPIHISATSPMRLYAVWKEPVNVKFYDGSNLVSTLSNPPGSTVTAPNLSDKPSDNPTYRLAGWSATNGGSIVYRVGDAVPVAETETSYYAVWNTLVSVTFTDPEGGNSNVVKKDIPGAVVTTPGFTREGFTLMGWSTTNGGSVEYAANADIIVPSSNLTLYARWAVQLDDASMPVAIVIRKQNSENFTNQENRSYYRAFSHNGYDYYYCNYTDLRNFKKSTDEYGTYWYVNGNQYPPSGTTDYSGNMGDRNINLHGNYMYVLDIRNNIIDRYTLNSSGDNLTGNNAQRLADNFTYSDGNGNKTQEFKRWFIAYSRLYREIQSAKAQLETMIANGIPDQSAYNTLSSKWTSAKSVYDNAKYGGDNDFIKNGSQNTASITTLSNAITNLTGTSFTPRTYGVMLPPSDLDDFEPDDEDGDLSFNDPANDPTDEPEEEPMDDLSDEPEEEPIDEPEDTPDNADTSNRESQSGSVPAGHWAGVTDGQFAEVAATNYRYRYDSGKNSVIRRTTSDGTFKLLPGQSAKFSCQFTRSSDLKAAQLDASYYITNGAGYLNSPTWEETRTAKQQKATEDHKMSQRYSTTWKLTDNNGAVVGANTGNSSYDNLAYTASELANIGGAFKMNYLKGKRATSAEFTELTLEYVNTVLVSDIKFTKKLDTAEDSNSDYDDEEFKFVVYFSNVFKGGSSEAIYTGDIYLNGDHESDLTPGNGTSPTVVTLKKNEYFIIKNVPVDTDYRVVEIKPTASTVNWQIKGVTRLLGTDGSTANAEVTFTESNGTMNKGDNVSLNNSVIGTFIGNFSDSIVALTPDGEAINTNENLQTGFLNSYQAYKALPSMYAYTVTNRLGTQYLIICKTINKLYYSEGDDPAGLLDGTLERFRTTGTYTPTFGGATGTQYDPNGYEGATDAKQTFIFKISEYSTSAFSGTPSAVMYETITFEKGDIASTSATATKFKVLKVNADKHYKVEEVTDWSWKYTLSAPIDVSVSNASQTAYNADHTKPINHYDQATQKIGYFSVFDQTLSPDNDVHSYANAAMVTFTNNKHAGSNDVQSKVEGDTSIEVNTFTKPAS